MFRTVLRFGVAADDTINVASYALALLLTEPGVAAKKFIQMVADGEIIPLPDKELYGLSQISSVLVIDFQIEEHATQWCLMRGAEVVYEDISIYYLWSINDFAACFQTYVHLKYPIILDKIIKVIIKPA